MRPGAGTVKFFSALVAAVVLFGCSSDKVISDNSSQEGYFRPEWKSLRNVAMPEWLADAKYGIFVDWGPVAVPAFMDEWYARWMYVEGHDIYKHHLETYGSQKDHGYIDFIP